MISMRWFRLYTEFRSDPKVRTMPESLQLRLVILMCLHAEGGVDDLDDEMIGHAFGVSPAEVDRTRKAFEGRRFIESGSWKLRSWAERQRDRDHSAERTRRYRERNDHSGKEVATHKETQVTHCDDDVASRAHARSEQNRLEQNREEKIPPTPQGGSGGGGSVETRTESRKPVRIPDSWAMAGAEGPIRDLVDRYGSEWVQAAVDQAISKGTRTNPAAFVGGILRRFAAQGGPDQAPTLKLSTSDGPQPLTPEQAEVNKAYWAKREEELLARARKGA